MKLRGGARAYDHTPTAWNKGVGLEEVVPTPDTPLHAGDKEVGQAPVTTPPLHGIKGWG